VAERDDLARELCALNGEIDAAYWHFTRCARALPPTLAVPAAYARRREVQARLRELDAEDQEVSRG